jgi:neutral ceramidase
LQIYFDPELKEPLIAPIVSKLFSWTNELHHMALRYSFKSRLQFLLPPSREALRAKFISSGVLGEDAYVVIAGPANTYAHYVTTPEEYAAQRYEGASTIFGQCKFSCLKNCRQGNFDSKIIGTIDAYIDKYSSMVQFLGDNASGTPSSDAPPAEQTSKAISLQVN